TWNFGRFPWYPATPTSPGLRGRPRTRCWPRAGPGKRTRTCPRTSAPCRPPGWSRGTGTGPGGRGAAEARRGRARKATAPPQAAQDGNAGGANERLNVAVIGVNGRGRGHVAGFAGRHNCVVTHVCDADSAVAGRALTAAERQQQQRPEFVQDLRRIMDNRNI